MASAAGSHSKVQELEPKPFASLGPVLLARKGGAKPAMRTHMSATDSSTEADPTAQSANDQDGTDTSHAEWDGFEDMEALRAEPEVKRQQDALVHRIADSNLAAMQAGSEATQARRTAVDQGRRAAFTLRLDAGRHLKLKLASTIHGVSAQQLVTQALDQFLSEMPEIESLAAQLRRDGSKA